MGERKEANRRASGAALDPYTPIRAKDGNEYPHTSTALGGQGSGLTLIQRTGTKKNTEEGNTFNVAKRGNCSYLERPGHTLISVGEGENEDDMPQLTLHVPDPADFHPPHKRREFLLDNGKRVILASRDATKSWDDEIFVTGNSTARVVRELFGTEKSEFLQPPTNKTTGM
jgi:hypothetical protein